MKLAPVLLVSAVLFLVSGCGDESTPPQESPTTPVDTVVVAPSRPPSTFDIALATVTPLDGSRVEFYAQSPPDGWDARYAFGCGSYRCTALEELVSRAARDAFAGPPDGVCLVESTPTQTYRLLACEDNVAEWLVGAQCVVASAESAVECELFQVAEHSHDESEEGHDDSEEDGHDESEEDGHDEPDAEG
jgi:hypothetical protein